MSDQPITQTTSIPSSDPTDDLGKAGVLVVGSLTMDFTAVAARMPQRGETVLGHQFAMVPGGKGNNQAIAVARQDVSTVMLGCVGDDELGPMVAAAVRDEGMVDALTIVPGPTGVAHIMVDGNGDNRIIMVPLANAALDAAMVAGHETLFKAAAVILTQLEVPLDAVCMALKLGRTHGAITILNPAPAQPLDEVLLGFVDILIPNETEAALLTGCDTTTRDGCIAAAETLRARGVGCVIVTRSVHGALVVDASGTSDVAPFTVEAVDATAAGDAFCGALAAGLANGESFDAALRRGAAAGALACTVLGASGSIPTREATESLLAGR